MNGKERCILKMNAKEGCVLNVKEQGAQPCHKQHVSHTDESIQGEGEGGSGVEFSVRVFNH